MTGVITQSTQTCYLSSGTRKESPGFAGDMMMAMVAVREHEFHNGRQYTNVNQIWQEVIFSGYFTLLKKPKWLSHYNYDVNPIALDLITCTIRAIIDNLHQY